MKKKSLCLKSRGLGTVNFVSGAGQLWLESIFGMENTNAGKRKAAERALGLVLVQTDHGRLEYDDLEVDSITQSGNRLSIRWSTVGGLVVVSDWKMDPATGVVTREDSLVNESAGALEIRGCFARFPFVPSDYEYYCQSSLWCGENNGRYAEPVSGSVVLKSEGGRSCQGYTPYLFLHDRERRRSLAFHVEPCGDWEIRLNTPTCFDSNRHHTVVELGHDSTDFRYRLASGKTLRCPRICIQSIPECDPSSGAPRIHDSLLAGPFRDSTDRTPVVYNTWFDVFDRLEVPRLRKQLTAAAEIGCEVFCVDAGWYGSSSEGWASQTGDWEEKKTGPFRGKMRAFADEVRGAGMGFGLWMEPERFSPAVPVVEKHPEWFLPGSGSNLYPDLENPDARRHVFSEICRLIETYELAWMKIDFNIDMNYDSMSRSFIGYTQAWRELVHEVKSRYPRTFLEACASGGMRSDIGTTACFGNHFLSDTVNPVEVLRIYQGAMLRLPPGRIGKWAVLRSIGRSIPKYGVSIGDTPVGIAVPDGATWNRSFTADMDFVVHVAMPGILGLSGDVAGLPGELKKRLAAHVHFYKKHRKMISRSRAHLLTPPREKTDASGWIGLQLQNRDTNFVFVYRLNDATSAHNFNLRGLSVRKRYKVKTVKASGSKACVMTGKQLMEDGLAVDLSEVYSSVVYEINA